MNEQRSTHVAHICHISVLCIRRYRYIDIIVDCCFLSVVVISVGCVAQLAERRSLAGDLTMSCARRSACS